MFAIIVHFNIQKLKNKPTFIQTEKAKSSHFDRTRGDKKQIFPTLLAHKIQSPQEREALQSLAVLEAGVKSCGPVFHAEVGKFKFLNEMIKLVSPKYLVSSTCS